MLQNLSPVLDSKNRFYRWISFDQTIRLQRMPLLVGCFDCSPCGKHIVVGQENKLVIYDPELNKQFGADLIGHKDLIILVVYSPDGNWIASMEKYKTAKIWDTWTQQLKHTLPGSRVLFNQLEFSPNSRQLITFDSGSIRIFDCNSGVQLKLIRVHSVTHARYSRNEQLLFSKAQNIKLWNINQARTVKQYTGYSDITSLAEARQGLIFAGSIELTITIWNKKSGVRLRVLQGHTGFIDRIVLSTDQRRMISQIQEETYLWDLYDLKYRRIPAIAEMDRHFQIKFSVNGKFMILKNGNYNLCIMKRRYILFQKLRRLTQNS